VAGGMRWDRPRGGGAVPRANRVADLTRTQLNLTVSHQFDLECGLRLGLVRLEGEERDHYARYDRTAARWRLDLSPWMVDELDFELDRLDREAAEREEGIGP
jgi:hypothetical protein